MEQPQSRIVTDAGNTNQYPDDAQAPMTKREKNMKVMRKPTPDDYDVNPSYNDPQDEYVNELEYPRNGNDQGIVIIFNQVHCYKEDPREGTAMDVQNIVFTLSRLGYNIDEGYIFSSLTTNEIHEKLLQIEEEDLSERNSLILIFLTHGGQEDMLKTRDGTIKATTIWESLGNHKDLSEKPKLFVFQACKGANHLSAPFRIEDDSREYKITSLSFANYSLPADILICFSSAEGMKSYRHTEKGSWLVQEICRNFLAFGRRDDVITLLTRVTKCVSTYEYKNTKQMPVIMSTLSKKFYLTKRKERTHLLASVELHNRIMQQVNQLKSLMEKKNSDVN